MPISELISVITRPKRLDGKVALITGAASGIGECTAKLFAHHGAKMVIADIQDERGRSVCEAFGSSNSLYVHCDVTYESHIKNAIIFNNAGIVEGNETKEDFKRLLRTNVTGVYLGIKHAPRVMIPAKTGCILSTASLSSRVGSHGHSCSKHSVVGLTENAAAVLGQFGIRVDCLSPAMLATPGHEGFRDGRGGAREGCDAQGRRCGQRSSVFSKR